jgi:hypothetical protein
MLCGNTVSLAARINARLVMGHHLGAGKQAPHYEASQGNQ